MDIGAESSYPTPLTNSTTLLSMLLLSLARQKNSPDTARTVRKEYDYIIVGAGTAGSVLANRLSEIPCARILLLEAGRPPPLLTEVPGYGRFFWFTDIDWQYRTAPQRYTGNGLINRQVVYPSGKALGGSSVLNANLFVRGSRKIYDQWAAEGAEGWSYKDVLPYFKKLEDNRDPEYVANGYHGVHGPQTVHRPQYKAEFKDPVIQAAKSMGYKIVDPNAYSQTGFYDHQATLRAGQKCSTAKSYLVPAENRINLDIVPFAMVRKVLIQNRRAVGVQFDFQGATFEVRAKHEVIVSAGTINTAQLLMLSGIGPRKELERHKIPVIADLPVGLNFQDHSGGFIPFLFGPQVPRFTDKLLSPANTMQYIQNRTGPLAATEFCSVLAFLQNHDSKPDPNLPDYQLYFVEAVSIFFFQLGVTPEYFAQYVGPYVDRAMWLCFSSPLHSWSKGSVTLQSADPYDRPVVDPNYFDDPRDLRDMVEGLKTCMRFGRHPQLQRVGTAPFQTLVPGCEKYVGNEDEYLACTARSAVMTWNHQVGTARMGHPKDPGTVVDPQLRVLHVDGLRVIDASVMPIIPTGNSNNPTIMIAEKASDIIKSTLECRDKHKEPETQDDPVFRPQHDSDAHNDHRDKYKQHKDWTQDDPHKEPESQDDPLFRQQYVSKKHNDHREKHKEHRDPWAQDDPLFRPEYDSNKDKDNTDLHRDKYKEHKDEHIDQWSQENPIFRPKLDKHKKTKKAKKDSLFQTELDSEKHRDPWSQEDSLFQTNFDTEDILAEAD